jgi:hypothetical protein
MQATIHLNRDVVATPQDQAEAKPWRGRIVSALPVLFLVFDGAVKLGNPSFVVESSVRLGLPTALAPVLGVLELALVALYVIPRTAVLGALLWTGYLGGAVAMHVRLSDPIFSASLFPIYVAALLWGGLYLRDSRFRAFVRGDRGFAR